MTGIKILTTLSVLAMSIMTLSAQSVDKMKVFLKDGSVVEYDMSAVDHVEMQTTTNQNINNTTSIGGTIADAVDLALPSGTMWAKHNLGASHDDEYGLYVPSSTQELSAWGNEWSIPTREQWQELYDNCTWSWTLLNGIEGRLLKSTKNGNTLFLPAAGISLDNETLISGAAGFYWTSDDNKHNTTSTIGIYFDSANIYRMEYPSNNGLSIRPVRSK